MVKKLLLVSFSLTLLASFILVSPVYALNGCPGGQFGTLCNMNTGDSTTTVRNIFNIMFVVAVLLTIGFLILGGIKWITSGGDKARLDAARGTITGAVIGLVITFSTFFILSLVNYFFGIDGGQRGTLFVLPQLNNTLPNYPVNGPAGGGDDGGGAPPDNTKGDGKGNF